MIYDADAPTVALEFEHLRSQQRRRHAERKTSDQQVLAAIKMLIGDWYVDEFGLLSEKLRRATSAIGARVHPLGAIARLFKGENAQQQEQTASSPIGLGRVLSELSHARQSRRARAPSAR